PLLACLAVSALRFCLVRAPPSTVPSPLSLHDALPIFTTTAQPSVDGARRLFEVSWDPSSEILLADGDAAAAATSAAFDRGALGSDRKSTRLNSSHVKISYAVFCLKKKRDENVNECDVV